MKKIVVIGSGGHAKVVIDLIEQLSTYEIIGVLTHEKIPFFCDYPVIGSDEQAQTILDNGCKLAALGVGGFRNNTLRKSIFNKYLSYGFTFPVLIHPTAYVSPKVTLEQGVVICAGCNIITGASLGTNTVVYTNSSIDHETKILSHVLVSAGVTIGAYSTIGEESLLSLGCKVISGIKIGSNVLIYAGAVVTSDILDNQKAVGIPAKIKM